MFIETAWELETSTSVDSDPIEIPPPVSVPTAGHEFIGELTSSDDLPGSDDEDPLLNAHGAKPADEIFGITQKTKKLGIGGGDMSGDTEGAENAETAKNEKDGKGGDDDTNQEELNKSEAVSGWGKTALRYLDNVGIFSQAMAALAPEDTIRKFIRTMEVKVVLVVLEL